jgi:hypothetical protein
LAQAKEGRVLLEKEDLKVFANPGARLNGARAK